jgi:hypothetical protein
VSYQPPSPGFYVPYPTAGTGAGAPPPPRRRTGLNLAFIASGLVVVLGLASGIWWYLDRVNTENPRVGIPAGASDLIASSSATPSTAATPHYSVAFPDQVDGLPMVTAASIDEGEALLSEVNTAHGVKFAALRVYQFPGDASHAIVVVAGTGAFGSPRDLVNEAFDRPDHSPAPIVPLGDSPNGATLRCDAELVNKRRISACLWADHGGFLLVADVGRGATTTANLLRAILPRVLRPA